MLDTLKTARFSLRCHLRQATRAFWLTGPSDDDIEHEHSWSISSALASQSRSVLTQIPEDLAEIIREAKSLHPVMAAGADRRDTFDTRMANARALNAVRELNGVKQ